jgi:hypothetical protein
VGDPGGGQGGYQGHAVASNPRSVVAGYARVWGPLAAVGALAAGSVSGFIASGAFLALTAWSWTWRSVRGPRERRRSEYHLLAFGTRCDPLHMEPGLLSILQLEIARRWALVADGRTPEDVARLGAASPAQAVLAYASSKRAFFFLTSACPLAAGPDAQGDPGRAALIAARDWPHRRHRRWCCSPKSCVALSGASSGTSRRSHPYELSEQRCCSCGCHGGNGRRVAAGFVDYQY